MCSRQILTVSSRLFDRVSGGDDPARVRPESEPVPDDQRAAALPVADVGRARRSPAADRVRRQDAGQGRV